MGGGMVGKPGEVAGMEPRWRHEYGWGYGGKAWGGGKSWGAYEHRYGHTYIWWVRIIAQHRVPIPIPIPIHTHDFWMRMGMDRCTWVGMVGHCLEATLTWCTKYMILIFWLSSLTFEDNFFYFFIFIKKVRKFIEKVIPTLESQHLQINEHHALYTILLVLQSSEWMGIVIWSHVYGCVCRSEIL
jgi:hypothetical protein